MIVRVLRDIGFYIVAVILFSTSIFIYTASSYAQTSDTTAPVITVNPTTITLEAGSTLPNFFEGVSTDDGSVNGFIAPWSGRNGHQVVLFNNVFWLLGGNNGTTLKNDVWKSVDGTTWTQVDSNGSSDVGDLNAPWAARNNHRAVSFNNALWLLGGNDGSVKNDVWTSTDGTTWTEVTTTGTKWSVRENHQVVSFGSALWLLGGNDGTTRKNDVWKSADGTNWTQVDANGSSVDGLNAPWSVRENHQVVSFGSALWLLGGNDGTTRKNDVWKSADGTNWTQVDANGSSVDGLNAPWSARNSHQVVSFNSALWLLGGRNADFDRANDVWKSTDGTAWTQIDANGSGLNAPWTTRESHQVVSFNNALWLLGGNDGSRKNDVWKSLDGSIWTGGDASAITSSGTFDINTAGTYTRTYSSTDTAGNIAINKTRTYTVTAAAADTEAPAAPTLSLKDSSNSGINTDGITSDNTPTITISNAEIGSRVSFTATKEGAASITGIRTGDGNITLLELSDGEWSIIATATDASGNESDPSTALVITIDTAVPVITVNPTTISLEAGSTPPNFFEGVSTDDGSVNGLIAPWSGRNGHQVVLFNDVFWLLGGTDGSRKNDVWKSVDGVTWTQVDANGSSVDGLNAPWSARNGHQVVSFNGAMWLLGGTDGSQKNDVWKSTNGTTWEEVITTGTKWSARDGHKVVSFGDALWLLAGTNGTNNLNDIWKSADGTTWTQVDSNGSGLRAPWATRNNHQVVLFNDTLWLLGGAVTGNRKNDIWKSTDGINWTNVTNNAPWSARFGHQVVSFNNTLWLLGGRSNIRTNDVWKSTDGTNWTQVDANGSGFNAPWSGREAHQVVSFNDALWLFGGYDGSNNKNDIWKSLDASIWTGGDASIITTDGTVDVNTAGTYTITYSSTDSAANTATTKTRVYTILAPAAPTLSLKDSSNSGTTTDLITSDNAPVITISNAETGSTINITATKQGVASITGTRIGNGDVALSTLSDGEWSITATATDASANASDASTALVITIDTAVPVITVNPTAISLEAGSTPPNFFEGVSTDDGSVNGLIAPWSGRNGHQVVLFNDVFWLLGGTDGSRKNDVWKSVDGVTWTQVDANGSSVDGLNAPWSARNHHRAVSFDGAIWLLGGNEGTNRTNDIWKSVDGITWTEVTTTGTKWSGRHQHQVVLFDSALWLLGGSDNEGAVKNDVWKSADGITWEQVDANGSANGLNAPWSAREKHQVVSFNGVLWLLGGYDGIGNPGLKNDIWKSADGTTWTEVTTTGTKWSARQSPQVVSFNNALWLLGGNDGFRKNDIWKSTDGTTWTQVDANGSSDVGDLNAPWNARETHQVVLSNNALWLLGGHDGTRRNDVWKSLDGSIWTGGDASVITTTGTIDINTVGTYTITYLSTDTAENAAINKTRAYTVTAAADTEVAGVLSLSLKDSSNSGITTDLITSDNTPTITISNAETGSTINITATKQGATSVTATSPGNGDVILSTLSDGEWSITATATDTSANTSDPSTALVITIDTAVPVITVNPTTISLEAGSTPPNFFEGVSTDDGSENGLIAPWSARRRHQAVSFNGALWLLGGNDGSKKNDVWKSTDGETWTQVDANGSSVVGLNAPWSPRWGHQAVSFNGALWILGGNGSTARENDVWTSTDGTSWTEVTTTGTKWSARQNHQVVSFNGDLWLLGGYDGSLKNDVWTSTDGTTWTEVTTTGTKWSERQDHQAVSFDSALWLLGGNDDSKKNDIWKSTDGTTWTEVITTGTKWSARHQHEVVSFNGALWLLGGNDGLHKNDVWKSTDGETWTEVTTTGTKWSERAGHQVIFFNNTLWLLGGWVGNAGKNDVWKSLDGSIWTGGDASTITIGEIFDINTVRNYTITYSSTDTAGNAAINKTRAYTVTAAAAADTEAPAAPTLSLEDSSNSGITTDLITSDNTPTITISNAETGSTINITAAKQGATSVTATSTGNGDVTLSPLSDGEWSITATATDTSANTSDASTDLVITIDTAVPVITVNPTTISLEAGSTPPNFFEGVSTDDGSVNGLIAPWSARNSHEVVSFNNALWLLGGYDGARKNDVWKSTDGETWTQVDANGSAAGMNAPWSAREDHQVVSFNGALWLFGGYDGSFQKNDIWKSMDGTTWTQIDSNGSSDVGDLNAPWSERRLHQVVSFNSALWLLGGFDSSSRKNDIWKSMDGTTWTQIDSNGSSEAGDLNAPWSARNAHQVVPFNNALWLLAGRDNTSNKNDIWKSTDGTTWEQVDANGSSAVGDLNAPWSAREDHQVVSFNNALWLLDGWDGSQKNDIWKSTDGTTWTQVDSNGSSEAGDLNPPWSSRHSHRVVSFNNVLWLLGGGNIILNTNKNDVWKSLDGSIWTGGDASTITSSGTFDINTAGNYTRTYSSADTAENAAVAKTRTYTVTATADTAIIPVITVNPTTITLEVGSTLPNLFDGVSTDDGSENGFIAPWSTREDHQAVSFNNALWLLGGDSGGTLKNDVWKSVDGATWTQVDSNGSSATGDLNAPWTARYAHEVVLFNNAIWLLGGYDGSHKNDIWKSMDGISWTEVTTTGTKWSGRNGHQVVSFNNTLWLLGGNDGSFKNDVWKSADGETWTQVDANGSESGLNAPWSPRRTHEVVLFDGAIWLSGGDQGGRKNDVWKSTDGATWTQVDANGSADGRSAPWDARNDHQVVSNNNALWLLGGSGNNNTRKNDIWKSTDGTIWTQVDANGSEDGLNAPWSGRLAHQVVSFNNALWLLGGNDGSVKNDVWKSLDGSIWTGGDASAIITSGTVDVNTIGTYTITYSSTNAEGNAAAPKTRVYTVAAAADTEAPAAPSISISPASVTVTAGTLITPITISSTGGNVASYSINPVIGNGLSFDTTTGIISGTPTAAASIATYTITATNTTGTDTATIAITVNAAGVAPDLPDISVSPGFQNATVGVAINPFVITNNGGTATYSISPALPVGLSIDTATGTVSGTPTELSSAIVYSITATNITGSDVVTFTLSVQPGAIAPNISVSPSSLTFTVGIPVTTNPITITNSGGTPDAGFVIVLNNGQSLRTDTGLNFSRAGVISGTPTRAVSAKIYTIRAENAAGRSETAITVTVNEGLSLSLKDSSNSGSNTDLITNDNTPDITISNAETGSTINITAAKQGATSVTATSPGNGDVTLSTLSDGEWSITATATNASGNTSDPSTALVITIDTAVPVITVNPTTITLGTVSTLPNFFDGVSTDDGSVNGFIAPWSARYTHQAVSHNNALWLLGGNDGSQKNDVWKSIDGTTWEEVITTGTKWSARDGHQVVSFNNALWLLGGNDGSVKNDVWTSTDGTSWTEVTTTGTKWSARNGHQVVSFNGALWLLGGNDGSQKNDVWKSIDGTTWEEVITTGTKWSARDGHQVVSFNNALWLLGGNDGTRYLNDIWKSADGTTWTQVDSNGSGLRAPWATRNNHQVVSFNDTLWLLGGTGGGGRTNDVWKSTDGSTWTQVDANGSSDVGDLNAPWSGRQSHQAVSFNNGIWLLGGRDGGQKNDIWKSLDGSIWTGGDASIITSSGTFDINTAGTYTRTYSSTDTAGNAAAPKTRAYTLTASDTEAPDAPTLSLNPSSDTGSNTDRITSDNTPTITISNAETGSTINITAAKQGATSVTGTKTGNGDVTLLELSDGEWSITATATDSSGNESDPSTALVITIDTTAPVITVNPTTITLVLGSASPNFNDGVSTDDGSPINSTGSFDITALGNYTITYSSTDTAGNAAAPKTRTYTVTAAPDTEAPGAPTLSLDPLSDTGVLNTDRITNDNTPNIRVTNAEAGSNVSITATKQGATSVTRTRIGNGDVTLPTLSDGQWSITATATDTSGNESVASTALVITIDTTLPSALTASITLSGTSSRADSITQSPLPTTIVDVETGASWFYSLNSGATVQGDTDGSDSFIPQNTAAFDNLADGIYSFVIYQVDIAGNRGPDTTVPFTIDNAPIAFTLALVTDSGPVQNDKITNDPRIRISETGTANELSELRNDWYYRIGTSGNYARGATGTHTNAFTIPQSAFTEGENIQVFVRTEDEAGNTSEGQFTILKYDNTSPTEPSLSLLEDTGVDSTDKITSNNTVNITNIDPSTTRMLFKIGASGFQNVPGYSAGDTSDSAIFGTDGSVPLTIIAEDESGNQSSHAEFSFVYDSTNPTQPTLDLVNNTTVSSGDGIFTSDGRINITTIDSNTADGTDNEVSYKYTINSGSPEAISISSTATSYELPESILGGEGEKVVNVIATDKAGNSSSIQVTLTLDKTAPIVTGIDLSSGSDTFRAAGNVLQQVGTNSDNLTSNRSPDFNITLENSSSTAGIDSYQIQYTYTGRTSASSWFSINDDATLNNQGDLPGIEDNNTLTGVLGNLETKTIGVKARDKAGNEGVEATTEVTFIRRQWLENRNFIVKLHQDDDSGKSNSDRLTNDLTQRFIVKDAAGQNFLSHDLAGGDQVVDYVVYLRKGAAWLQNTGALESITDNGVITTAPHTLPNPNGRSTVSDYGLTICSSAGGNTCVDYTDHADFPSIYVDTVVAAPSVSLVAEDDSGVIGDGVTNAEEIDLTIAGLEINAQNFGDGATAKLQRWDDANNNNVIDNGELDVIDTSRTLMDTQEVTKNLDVLHSIGEGITKYVVHQLDDAGNEATTAIADALTLIVDRTAPLAPSIPDLNPANDTFGVYPNHSKTGSDNDNITNDDNHTYFVDAAARQAGETDDLIGDALTREQHHILISSLTTSASNDKSRNPATPDPTDADTTITSITGSNPAATLSTRNINTAARFGNTGSALVSRTGRQAVHNYNQASGLDKVHFLAARQRDLAGNLSAWSDILTVQIDKVLPESVTSRVALHAASDSGTSSHDSQTGSISPIFVSDFPTTYIPHLDIDYYEIWKLHLTDEVTTAPGAQWQYASSETTAEQRSYSYISPTCDTGESTGDCFDRLTVVPGGVLEGLEAAENNVGYYNDGVTIYLENVTMPQFNSWTGFAIYGVDKAGNSHRGVQQSNVKILVPPPTPTTPDLNSNDDSTRADLSGGDADDITNETTWSLSTRFNNDHTDSTTQTELRNAEASHSVGSLIFEITSPSGIKKDLTIRRTSTPSQTGIVTTGTSFADDDSNDSETGSDPHTGTLEVDLLALFVGNATDGIYSIRSRAVNTAGDFGGFSSTVSIVLDREAPSAGTELILNSYEVNASSNVSYVAEPRLNFPSNQEEGTVARIFRNALATTSITVSGSVDGTQSSPNITESNPINLEEFEVIFEDSAGNSTPKGKVKASGVDGEVVTTLAVHISPRVTSYRTSNSPATYVIVAAKRSDSAGSLIYTTHQHNDGAACSEYSTKTETAYTVGTNVPANTQCARVIDSETGAVTTIDLIDDAENLVANFKLGTETESDDSRVATDYNTNNNTPRITGTTLPGSIVKVQYKANGTSWEDSTTGVLTTDVTEIVVSTEGITDRFTTNAIAELADGVYNFRAIVTNTQSGINDVTVNLSDVTIDTTPVSLSSSLVAVVNHNAVTRAKGYTNVVGSDKSVTFEVSGYSETPVEKIVSIDGNRYINGVETSSGNTQTVQVNLGANFVDGTYTASVILLDIAGNEIPISLTSINPVRKGVGYITVDTTPPVITVIETTTDRLLAVASDKFAQVVTTSFVSSDNPESQCNSGSFSTGGTSYTPASQIDSSTSSLCFRVADLAGNLGYGHEDNSIQGVGGLEYRLTETGSAVSTTGNAIKSGSFFVKGITSNDANAKLIIKTTSAQDFNVSTPGVSNFDATADSSGVIIFDVTGLADGEYQIASQVEVSGLLLPDVASLASTGTFIVDTKAPTFNIEFSDTAGTVNIVDGTRYYRGRSATITPTGDNGDIESVTLDFDSDSSIVTSSIKTAISSQSTALITIPGSATTGLEDLTFTAVDAAGNRSPKVFNVVVDIIAPTSSQTGDIAVGNARRPSVTFPLNSNQVPLETLKITIGGPNGCDELTSDVITNSGITENSLTTSIIGSRGVKEDCTISVSDYAGNSIASPLTLSDFSILSGGGGGGRVGRAPVAFAPETTSEIQKSNVHEETKAPIIGSTTISQSQVFRIGQSSPEVLRAQKALNENTCKVATSGPGSRGSETSYFGPATQRAIHCFQRVNKLVQTGLLDQATKDALHSEQEVIKVNEVHTALISSLKKQIASLTAKISEMIRQRSEQLQRASTPVVETPNLIRSTYSSGIHFAPTIVPVIHTSETQFIPVTIPSRAPSF